MAAHTVQVDSRDDLLAIVANFALEHGERFHVKTFMKQTGVTETHYLRWFDSWSDVREAVGLIRNPQDLPRYTDDQLAENYHRVVKKLGRLPTCTELQFHGKHSEQTYRRRFGSVKEMERRWSEWMKRTFPGPGEAPVEPLTNPQPFPGDAMNCLRFMWDEWYGMRVGFELGSSDFKERPANACDLLVVLRHDWPGCPVRVVEFETIRRKPTGADLDG